MGYFLHAAVAANRFDYLRPNSGAALCCRFAGRAWVNVQPGPALALGAGGPASDIAGLSWH